MMTQQHASALQVPDSHRDLLESPVAVLATVGSDGRPQVSAVWFLVDDGVVRFSLNTARQKVKNLQRNAACTVFILDLANPMRYLEIRGDAQISPDSDYGFADRVGAIYGTDLRRMDAPGETRVIVAVHPVKINAVDLSGG